MSAAYIELHASSAFSFLEGASLPEKFIGACAEYSMPAMALLDFWINQGTSMILQLIKRALLVSDHEPAVASHVGQLGWL